MYGFNQNDKYIYILLEFIRGGELFTLLKTIEVVPIQITR